MFLETKKIIVFNLIHILAELIFENFPIFLKMFFFFQISLETSLTSLENRRSNKFQVFSLKRKQK